MIRVKWSCLPRCQGLPLNLSLLRFSAFVQRNPLCCGSIETTMKGDPLLVRSWQDAETAGGTQVVLCWDFLQSGWRMRFAWVRRRSSIQLWYFQALPKRDLTNQTTQTELLKPKASSFPLWNRPTEPKPNRLRRPRPRLVAPAAQAALKVWAQIVQHHRQWQAWVGWRGWRVLSFFVWTYFVFYIVLQRVGIQYMPETAFLRCSPSMKMICRASGLFSRFYSTTFGTMVCFGILWIVQLLWWACIFHLCAALLKVDFAV